MTPDLKYKQYVLDKLVSDLEGFLVYYNPQFKSWWWINPDTKEWRFEFKDSGTLYWFYGWGDNFISKYSLEESEFVEVISRYVEHTLQNGVVHTLSKLLKDKNMVEHTLQNGVVNSSPSGRFRKGVEETIQNGVFHTAHIYSPLGDRVEHTLENGVINTLPRKREYRYYVEETLQNGVVNTISQNEATKFMVDHTLQNGSIINQ